MYLLNIAQMTGQLSPATWKKQAAAQRHDANEHKTKIELFLSLRSK